MSEDMLHKASMLKLKARKNAAMGEHQLSSELYARSSSIHAMLYSGDGNRGDLEEAYGLLNDAKEQARIADRKKREAERLYWWGDLKPGQKVVRKKDGLVGWVQEAASGGPCMIFMSGSPNGACHGGITHNEVEPYKD